MRATEVAPTAALRLEAARATEERPRVADLPAERETRAAAANLLDSIVLVRFAEPTKPKLSGMMRQIFRFRRFCRSPRIFLGKFARLTRSIQLCDSLESIDTGKHKQARSETSVRGLNLKQVFILFRLQIRNEINHLNLIKATASYLQKYQVVDHPPFLHLHLLVLLHSSMPQDHTQ